ncbi:MAG: orotidine 5'-phosphate decarboxylase [Candidatus Bathyarchaeota archaeon]|nr:MAG: orotidine 5'-phosphate decarboxylase [Candidatus Bathyarchaeota archaeon]
MSFRKKIVKSSEEKKSNIVLALDLPPNDRTLLLKRAARILESTQDHICAVKLNRHLLLPLGLFDGVQDLIFQAKEYQLPIIMDCKINDIGNTNRIIAEHYFGGGFDAVTANPFVGWDDGLQPVFETARNIGRGVILLVYMSHRSAGDGYGREFVAVDGTRTPAYMIFARRAVEWNADGAVVGATYPERIGEIHSVLEQKVPIYAPGVGAQGGTISLCMNKGVRYLIVGRTITLASDPGRVAEKIKNQTRAS